MTNIFTVRLLTPSSELTSAQIKYLSGQISRQADLDLDEARRIIESNGILGHKFTNSEATILIEGLKTFAEDELDISIDFGKWPTHLKGIVKDISTGAGLADAEVRLVTSQSSTTIPEYLGETRTDHEGKFEIIDFGVNISRFYPEQTVEVTPEVIHDSAEITIESHGFSWEIFERQGNFPDDEHWVDINISLPSTDVFVVKGRVVDHTETPVDGYTVVALDRDLRWTETLGRGVTGEVDDGESRPGEFEIRYTSADFSRSEKESADLIIQVLDSNESVLFSSEVKYNAPRVMEIDVLVLPEPTPDEVPTTEYEKLQAELDPILRPSEAIDRREEVTLSDLTEDDIEFLRNELEIDELEGVFVEEFEVDSELVTLETRVKTLEYLKVAATLEERTDVRLEVFYGLFRAGLYGSTPEEALQTIADAGTDSRTNALQAVRSASVISELSDEDLESALAALDHLEADIELEERLQWPVFELSGTLVHEASNDPLRGFRVDAHHVDDIVPEDLRVLGEVRTLGDGSFGFTYTLPETEAEKSEAHQFELTISTEMGHQFESLEVNALELEAPLVVELTPPKPFSEDSTEIEPLVQSLELDSTVEEVFETEGISTLADVLSVNSLFGFEGMPYDELTPATRDSIRTLEHHAILSTVSTNPNLNSVLIDQGYTSPAAIYTTDREDFLAIELPDDVDASVEDLESIHEASRRMGNVVINLNREQLVERANNSEEADWGILKDPDLELIDLNVAEGLNIDPGILEHRCSEECRDCDSAVSPRAYLADLLWFVLSNVKKEDGDAVTLDDLVQKFRQPFGDLPASCEATEERVNQLRLCIEVLLEQLYYEAQDSSVAPDVSDEQRARAQEALRQLGELDSAGHEYRREAYETLLQQLGTSYEELRDTRYSDDESDRERLAARIGIQTEHLYGAEEPQGGAEYGLFLDPTAELVSVDGEGANREYSLNPRGLSETNLERIFGLRAFTGFVFPASGSEDEDAPSIEVLDPLRDEETSLLREWREGYLLDQWREQDHPTDPYSVHDIEAGQQLTITRGDLPIVDPDLIGPDDFRDEVEAFKDDEDVPLFPTNRAFTLWRTRREWVDGRLDSLRSASSTGELLEGMRSKLSYPDANTEHPGPWIALTPGEVRQRLTDHHNLLVENQKTAGSTSSSYETVREAIETELYLTIDSFLRLMELLEKRDATPEAIEESEEEELYSILVQAMKRSLFEYWIREEHGETAGPNQTPTPIYLDPKTFWVPLREPSEGRWSNIIDSEYGGSSSRATETERPFLDPELVDVDQLVEGPAGRLAAEILSKRRDILDEFAESLEIVYHEAESETEQTNPFEALLDEVYGADRQSEHSPFRDIEDWASVFETVLTKLEEDPSQAEAELSWLHLEESSVRSFARLRAKASSQREDTLSEAELKDTIEVLTRVHKERTFYSKDPGPWVQVEKEDNLRTYWKVFKAALPAWRVSSAARQQWQAGLRIRSKPPIVDPENVVEQDQLPMTGIVPGTGSPGAPLVLPADAPRRLDTERTNWIDERVGDLEKYDLTTSDIDERVKAVLGIPTTELIEIDDQREEGVRIGSRLDQLNLQQNEFSRLVRLYRRSERVSPLDTTESSDIVGILLAARKRREYGEWYREERIEELVLGPHSFEQVTSEDREEVEAHFTGLEEDPVRQWLWSRKERRNWTRTLESRIDQLETIATGLHETLEEAEEQVLHLYRDLTLDSVAPSSDQDEDAAERVADRFLIDTLTGGCQSTTRIAQAIETLQSLVNALRTSQNLELVNIGWNTSLEYLTDNSSSFDEFSLLWKWIGSYASWKAAMSVFLYPENVLLPTLNRKQTPIFKEVVRKSQEKNLTVGNARSLGKRYSRYLRAVMDMQIVASASINDVTFLFGVSDSLEKSGKQNVYWCISPADSPSNISSHMYWSPISGIAKENISSEQVLGAVPYNKSIYLFLKLSTPDSVELAFLKLNGLSNQWSESEPQILDLPSSGSNFEAVVVQSRSDGFVPELVIRQSGSIYLQSFNSAGTGWSWERRREDSEDDDEIAENVAEWNLIYPELRGEQFYRLEAAVRTHFGRTLIWSKNRKLYYRVLDSDAIPPVSSRHTVPFIGILPSSYSIGVLTESNDSVYMDRTNFSRDLGEIPMKGRKRLYWFDKHVFKSLGGVSLTDISINELEDALYEISGDYIGFSEFDDVLNMIVRTDSHDFERYILPGIQYLVSSYLKEDSPRGQAWDYLDRNIHKWVSFLRDGILVEPTNISKLFSLVREQSEGDHLTGYFWRTNISTTGRRAISNYRMEMGRHSGDTNRFAGTLVYKYPERREQRWLSLPVSESGEPIGQLERMERIAPAFETSVSDSLRDYLFEITDNVSRVDSRQRVMKSVLLDNNDEGLALTYLWEGGYFVQVLLAGQLQRAGEYVSALDWYKNVYDYSETLSNRKIWHGLRKEESFNLMPDREGDWIVDPVNPHSIASIRRNAYTRYTICSIVGCLLDFADNEFTRDTSESVAKARTLYKTALWLLEAPELAQKYDPCTQWNVEKPFFQDPELEPINLEIKKQLDGIENLLKKRHTEAAVHELASSESDPQNLPERVNAVFDLLHERVDGEVETYEAVFTNYAANLRTIERSVVTDEYWARLLQHGIMSHIEGSSIGPFTYKYCIPRNPLLKTLRTRAEMNLFKIRSCRNIAGMKRELEPYAAPTDVASGLPAIGADGTISLPSSVPLQPTPYRYRTLIARSKELVGHAQQLESTFLSLLEKLDEENYRLLNAEHGTEIARSSIKLQGLRVKEAQEGIELAELQLERVETQFETFSEWMTSDLNEYELEMVDLFEDIAGLQSISAMLGAFSQAASAGVAAQAVAVAAIGQAAAQTVIATNEATIRENQIRAAHEYRKQEWRFQKALAQHDQKISSQQISIANTQLTVAEQELSIAELRSEQAEEVLEFLREGQFTTAELYDWMIGILEDVYRYFVQQATAVAKLAQTQLAFERGEAPAEFIRSDYWQPPREGLQLNSESGESDTDRRGLTGSARLLRDIYELDQYAFETTERKLEIRKTFSLAQLDPYAFQQFRETGVLPFTTPMEAFDRDHPGHYLRLIRNVRTSVVALTPPTDGIKATLTSGGISRVVNGEYVYGTRIVRRDPETVALSSPVNDTGLLELRPDDEKLYPFEGTGVHTTWELRMPKAVNQFDYNTIADVLFTVEYTALDSYEYRQEILQHLDPELSTDRVFSFRNELADQWYDLNNPEQTPNPMSVSFETGRADFLPNLSDLAVENILLYLVGEDDTELDKIPVTLTVTNDGGTVGGESMPIDGIISTRKGNGSSWMPTIGRTPVGTWMLSFPDTAEVRRLFEEDRLTDILVVLTYRGLTPSWPQ